MYESIGGHGDLQSFGGKGGSSGGFFSLKIADGVSSPIDASALPSPAIGARIFSSSRNVLAAIAATTAIGAL
jgi:hypothetical protein